MKVKSLRNARSIDELCALKRDNFELGDYWIMSDGETVSIAHQARGEMAKAMVSVPIRTFNGLFDRYQKDQSSKRGGRDER